MTEVVNSATSGLLATAATIAALAAGAAVLEVALLPGLALGAAAVLAPGLWRGRAAPGAKSATGRARPLHTPARAPTTTNTLEKLDARRALVKTITFRVLVTSLDFSTNLLVLGDVPIAAGLSAFSLVTGPLFFFLHETSWSYFRPESGADTNGRTRLVGIAMSRPIAKTITYRGFATVAEFAATYIVVQDVAMAALLSSFGFVLGPFVYYGHERAWEILGGPRPLPARPLALAHSGAGINP